MASAVHVSRNSTVLRSNQSSTTGCYLLIASYLLLVLVTSHKGMQTSFHASR
jgi:hypothetical protein